MAERPPPSKFTERLSMFMVAVAALGAFWVLADPKFAFELWGQSVKIDGAEFSADLKGAVIFAILIGGWVAVKEYWLGNSDSGKQQQESISRIAEQSAPVSAAAVAAATGAPPAAASSIKTDEVKIDATDVVVNAAPPATEDK